jgi:hypothetical protein
MTADDLFLTINSIIGVELSRKHRLTTAVYLCLMTLPKSVASTVSSGPMVGHDVTVAGTKRSHAISFVGANN